MLLKASEFNFPDTVRRKYFPLVIRASPPEGWPRGTVVVSENKVPYRCFLQIIGASPAAEFEAEIGEYQDSDPRITLSMLEEIALNCPLREDEAAGIKKEYETASAESHEKRPPLFVQGLISPIFCAFEAGILSFSSALVLSLYTNAQVQWEIAGLGLLDKSPEAVLKVFTDPFFPGDFLNRVAREPGKLKALGCESFRDFLKEHSPILLRPKSISHAPCRSNSPRKKIRAYQRSRRASFEHRESQKGGAFSRRSDFPRWKNARFERNFTPKPCRDTKTHSKSKRGKRWR